MAHNVSRTKQEDMAQARARAELLPYLSPGYSLTLDRLPRIQEDPTIKGAWQRGQTVLYRCQREDCRRRSEPDLRHLVHAGHGHMTPKELGHWLRCQHPLGCQLKLDLQTYPRGLPLTSFVMREGTLIVVTCGGCRLAVSRSGKTMIDALRAAKRGGPGTGYGELKGLIRGPCRKCGGRDFAVTSEEAGSGGPSRGRE